MANSDMRDITIIKASLIAFPPVVGLLIPICSDIVFFLSFHNPHVVSFFESKYEVLGYIYVSIPHFIVSILMVCYNKKGLKLRSLVVMALSMTLPITVVSIYFYAKFSSDPFVLATLPIFNLIVLWVAKIVGEIIIKVKYEEKSR